MLTPEEQLFLDTIHTDEDVAKQVFQIMNALGAAQVNGQAVVMPASKDSPIVLISYTQELKDMISNQLEAHGQTAPWDIDE